MYLCVCAFPCVCVCLPVYVWVSVYIGMNTMHAFLSSLFYEQTVAWAKVRLIHGAFSMQACSIECILNLNC